MEPTTGESGGSVISWCLQARAVSLENHLWPITSYWCWCACPWSQFPEVQCKSGHVLPLLRAGTCRCHLSWRVLTKCALPCSPTPLYYNKRGSTTLLGIPVQLKTIPIYHKDSITSFPTNYSKAAMRNDWLSNFSRLQKPNYLNLSSEVTISNVLSFLLFFFLDYLQDADTPPPTSHNY